MLNTPITQNKNPANSNFTGKTPIATNKNAANNFNNSLLNGGSLNLGGGNNNIMMLLLSLITRLLQQVQNNNNSNSGQHGLVTPPTCCTPAPTNPTPVVQDGPATVTPPVVQDGPATVTPPVVQDGPATVTPPVVQDGPATVTPPVVQDGPATVTPPVVQDGPATVTPPVVQDGPATVTPPVVQDGPATVTPPVVQDGPATVTPPVVQDGPATVTPPVVQDGPATVTPPVVQDGPATVTPPVVQDGPATVTPPVVQDGPATVTPPVVQDGPATVTPPVVQDGPATVAPPVVQDGPATVTPPVVQDGPATVTPPVVQDGPATVTPPVVQDGPATVAPPVVQDGPATVTPPVVQDGPATVTPPVVQDGPATVAPPATNVGFGNQSPVQSDYANGQLTLNNSASYDNTFLHEKLQEFRNSDQYPSAQTFDLGRTPWGYSGSSSVLTAFENYLIENYPEGGTGTTPPEVRPPATGFGNQSPVQSDYANGQLTLNNSASYDNTFLNEKLQEFRNSDQYPPVQTRDLARTPWGYSGSGSVLTAFENYLVENYPEGGTSTTPSEVRPPATGFGNQSPVQSDYANGQLTLNNSASYDNTFLNEKLQEFRNSDQYPPAQTRDLARTPWGYSGSGSALTAFENYLVENYPEGGTGTTSPDKGVGNQSSIQSNYANGQLTLNDSATYNNAFLNEKLQEFQTSDEYPQLQTADLISTPWGYNGSSSALTAFYANLAENYPQGGVA